MGLFLFEEILTQERQWLEKVDVPVVTVSASFMREMARHLDGEFPQREEIVLSRAHYSQSVAVLSAAAKMGKSFWLIDPLNYVSAGLWPKVLFAEKMGEAAARIGLLKKLKDLSDSIIRERLPIHEAIKTPLLFAFEKVSRPIVAFHYEAANILLEAGKTILAVVTDPYVREQYIRLAENPRLFWAVFDQETKAELIEKVGTLGKELTQERVVVTGPPVDPRVVEAREKKNPKDILGRPLRLAILTGGLGANKKEIEKAVSRLLDCHRRGICQIQLIGYGGTHKDFEETYYRLAQKYQIKIGKTSDEKAQFRVIYAEEENIIEANEKLIDLVFPWADGLITKPSGDMAYDGAAAGCFLLFLSPWGEWENRVHRIFEKRQIGVDLDFDHADTQINCLLDDGWMERAIQNALDLPELFLKGAENIIKTQERLTGLNPVNGGVIRNV